MGFAVFLLFPSAFMFALLLTLSVTRFHLLGNDFVKRLPLSVFAKADVKSKPFPYRFLILPPDLQKEEKKRIIIELIV